MPTLVPLRIFGKTWSNYLMWPTFEWIGPLIWHNFPSRSLFNGASSCCKQARSRSYVVWLFAWAPQATRLARIEGGPWAFASCQFEIIFRYEEILLESFFGYSFDKMFMGEYWVVLDFFFVSRVSKFKRSRWRPWGAGLSFFSCPREGQSCPTLAGSFISGIFFTQFSIFEC